MNKKDIKWAVLRIEGTNSEVSFEDAYSVWNASVGYRFNNYLRVSATAANLFDQQRFSLYGGAVVGRRVLAQVEANF